MRFIPSKKRDYRSDVIVFLKLKNIRMCDCGFLLWTMPGPNGLGGILGLQRMVFDLLFGQGLTHRGFVEPFTS